MFNGDKVQAMAVVIDWCRSVLIVILTGRTDDLESIRVWGRERRREKEMEGERGEVGGERKEEVKDVKKEDYE